MVHQKYPFKSWFNTIWRAQAQEPFKTTGIDQTPDRHDERDK